MVRIGDVLHGISIIVVCGQFTALITDINGLSNIFSDFYRKEGFCRSREENDIFDSFLWCFYVDTAFCLYAALFLTAFPHTDKMKPGSSEIWKAIPGVFAHGVAHLAQYTNYLPQHGDMSLPNYWVLSGFKTHMKTLIPTFMFWFFLTQAALNGSAKGAAISTPILTFIIHVFVPRNLGFVFVNAVLIVMFSISNLVMRDDKDGWYDLYAALVSFPIGIIGWIEGYFCLDFVRRFGGHVWYDGWICFGNVIFMLVALAYADKEKPKIKTS